MTNKTFNHNSSSSIIRIFDKIFSKLDDVTNIIKNLINNFDEDEATNNKYYKERELNRFSDEIGEEIIIEYTSQENILKKKSFIYKDRATTFINMLESNGYKNYSKYNVNPENGLTYLVFNKNKDIVDVFTNKIQIEHDDKNYKIITEGWPEK
jgi:hypothetical protein